MPVTVVIRGVPEAVKMTAQYREGAAALASTTVLIGTTVDYAIYQEEGTRFQSGTHFLRDALAAVTPAIGPAITAALPKGAASVRGAMHGLGFKVQGGAQQRARVDTGNLRGSIHTTTGGRL